MQIRDHHQRAIDRLADAYRDNPRFRGLIIGRLILAHNRRLFPYHKWLPRALESAPEKPNDLMACFNDLLIEPCGDHASALFEGVRAFQDWGVSDLEAYTWFMTDVEWSWTSGRTPIEDC